jgi:predicted metalloprotease with PDZ domain
MRLLHKRFGITKTPYTLDDLAAAASDVAGRDMRPFFTKYISGTELLPIREALRKAGLASTTQLYDGEIYVRRDSENRTRWP